MAILDAFLQLSNAQAITTTAASTNIIDLQSELGDALESGVWVRVAVTTAIDFTGVGELGLQAQIQTGESTTFANGVTLAQSASITAESTLVAGYEILCVKLPKNCKRYLRVYYVCAGAITTGNVDAHILTNVDSLITDVEGT